VLFARKFELVPTSSQRTIPGPIFTFWGYPVQNSCCTGHCGRSRTFFFVSSAKNAKRQALAKIILNRIFLQKSWCFFFFVIAAWLRNYRCFSLALHVAFCSILQLNSTVLRTSSGRFHLGLDFRPFTSSLRRGAGRVHSQHLD